jgi:hypothetical protein
MKAATSSATADGGQASGNVAAATAASLAASGPLAGVTEIAIAANADISVRLPDSAPGRR